MNLTSPSGNVIRTLSTTVRIAFAAVVLAAVVAPLWVWLLQDQPEPLPDRLRYCPEAQWVTTIPDEPGPSVYCLAEKAGDCFDGAEVGKIYGRCMDGEVGIVGTYGFGPFTAKCKAEPGLETCTKEVMERQLQDGRR